MKRTRTVSSPRPRWFYLAPFAVLAGGCGNSETPQGTPAEGMGGMGGAGVTSANSGMSTTQASGVGGAGSTTIASASTATTTAGTGGAKAPPLPCPAGIGAVGVWEEITPPQIPFVPDNPPGTFNGSLGMCAVAVDPQNPATVYTSGNGTSAEVSSGVFKSTDCGATWTHVDTGQNGALLESGSQWYSGIAVDSTNPQVLYTLSGYGAEGVWKSTNGGVDWNQLSPKGGVIQTAVPSNFTEDIGMDPTDPTHIVLAFHDNCVAPFTPLCMGETKDGGATWRVFNGPPLGGWQEAAGALVLDKTTYLYSAPGNGVYYTKDSGVTWEKVADSGYFQLYQSKNGSMYVGSNNGILRSTDGHQWTLIPGSPKATNVIGDGTTLYSGFTNDFDGQPFYTAAESDPTTWTNLKTPTMTQGPSWLTYDSAHHILYSASLNGGLWRVVTQ